MKNKFRAYVIMNNEAHFTKKMSLDEAIKFITITLNNDIHAGIINADLPLEDAKKLFTSLHEPTCGWEE